MMKALVLHDSPIKQARIAAELMGKGFQVAALGSQAAAREWLTLDMVDVLVMDECVGSALTHSIALSAERRNPYVSVVMLTERTGEDAEELYLLIPSLYSLLGRDTVPAMVARLAMASVVNVSETEERVRSRKLWFAGQDQDNMLDDLRPARDIAAQIEDRITAAKPPAIPRVAMADAGLPLSVRVPSFLSRPQGATVAHAEPRAGVASAAPPSAGVPSAAPPAVVMPAAVIRDWADAMAFSNGGDADQGRRYYLG